MNKKEVTEIRRQYTPERCTITCICGCYIDGEKNIKTELKEAFLSLPEDDVFKYFAIFKKSKANILRQKEVKINDGINVGSPLCFYRSSYDPFPGESSGTPWL